MSVVRIARNVGCSSQAVINALIALEDRGLITKRAGDTVFTNGKFVAGSNSYKYRPPFDKAVGEKIPVNWDFKEETFANVYADMVRRTIPHENWPRYFTKKELEELKAS